MEEKTLHIDKFMQQAEYDDNKYLFTYGQDIAWEDQDLGKDIKKLNEAYEAENAEEFMRIYNKYYSTDIFNIFLVMEMKGPGAAWPYVMIKSIKPMTIKDFIKQWEEENQGNIDDYLIDITLYKYE